MIAATPVSVLRWSRRLQAPTLISYTAAIVKVLRAIIGPAWNPSVVHLALRKPRNDEPYRNFFRCPIAFNQSEYAVFVPDSVLELQRPGGDPRLATFVFERLCELEAQTPGDLVRRVRQAIEAQLMRGRCDVSNVAQLFAVHRKTLHAYLRDAGTSFTELLEEQRKALAANLTRAFRRWYGEPPRDWRQRAAERPAAKRIAHRGQRRLSGGPVGNAVHQRYQDSTHLPQGRPLSA